MVGGMNVRAASHTFRGAVYSLEKSGFPRISILRMNIGGAELTVLGSNYEPWLCKVDRMATAGSAAMLSSMTYSALICPSLMPRRIPSKPKAR